MDPLSPTFGDVVIEDGDLVLTENQSDGIRQHILQRLRIFLGEWFLDNTIGLPYYQQILVKAPQLSKVNALFISQIAGTPGVQSISKWSFVPNFTTRSLAITFIAQTTSGTVDYSGSITV